MQELLEEHLIKDVAKLVTEYTQPCELGKANYRFLSMGGDLDLNLIFTGTVYEEPEYPHLGRFVVESRVSDTSNGIPMETDEKAFLRMASRFRYCCSKCILSQTDVSGIFAAREFWVLRSTLDTQSLKEPPPKIALYRDQALSLQVTTPPRLENRTLYPRDMMRTPCGCPTVATYGICIFVPRHMSSGDPLMTVI